MTSTKRNLRLAKEINQSAREMFKFGLISKRKMAEYDFLCNLQVEQMTAFEIKSLRNKYHVSQSVLAEIMNVSPSTIRQWEIGDKKPTGSALKLLSIIKNKGLEVIL